MPAKPTTPRPTACSRSARRWWSSSTREHGVTYPLQSVIITAGGRPAIYAVFRCLVNRRRHRGVPGAQLEQRLLRRVGRCARAGGHRGAEPGTSSPRRAAWRPTCGEATPALPLLSGQPHRHHSPSRGAPRNHGGRRRGERAAHGAGRRPLFVLHDLMYGSLVFDGTRLMPTRWPWCRRPRPGSSWWTAFPRRSPEPGSG